MKREKGGVSVKEAIGHGAVFSQSKHRQREKATKTRHQRQPRPSSDLFPAQRTKKKRAHISLSPIIIVKKGERGKKMIRLKEIKRKGLRGKVKIGKEKKSKNNDKSHVLPINEVAENPAVLLTVPCFSSEICIWSY